MDKMQHSSLNDKTLESYSFGQRGPTIALKEGIDVNDLMKPGSSGAELEFSTEDIEEEFQDMNIGSNKAYFEGMRNVTRMFDDDSDEEQCSLSWFDRMKLKMHNITEDGGVKKLVKKEGVGIVVPPGSRIRAHYDGYLEDLDEPYDSSRLRDRELQITLGKAEVILGLDIGLASMKVNEVARFLVSPSYAYGDMGCPPRIPGGASILFEVELIAFIESTALDDYNDMPEDEKKELPFAKILEVAKANNAVGNDLFGQEIFGKAIRKYMLAINTLESAHLKNGDEEERVVGVCVKSYLNMALCHMKLAQYGKSLAAAKKVLEWKGQHAKALYICGKCLRHMGNFSESRRYLLRARDVAPRSKDIATELKVLDHTEMRCRSVEKDMCVRMFS